MVTEMGDDTSKRVDNPSNNNKLFKVIVVGNRLVGKSSFIIRYVYDDYDTRKSIGLVYFFKRIKMPDKETVRLEIVDFEGPCFSGPEDFGCLTELFYRKASGCIIMFDVSDPCNFNEVIKWKYIVERNVQLPDGRPIPCMLLGNKTDLSKDVADEQIETLCRLHSFIGWSTISVKDNTNIAAPMLILVERILETERKSNMCKTDLVTTSDSNFRLPDDPENCSRFCCFI